MKHKLLALGRNLLVGCMAFSWWVECDFPSVVFFGEHEYPKKPEEK